MAKYIAAIDQGTTSSRCMIFEKNGALISSAVRKMQGIYPKRGWVEQDAEMIYETSLSVLCESMIKAGADGGDIAALGITNQRETTIVWDRRSGKSVYNAIVWQCRRGAGKILEIKEAGWASYISKKTGLVPDAYFCASKIAWILEHVEGAREKAKKGDLLFGTVDTWLTWKLSGGRVHATDHTNAARTMLYDIRRLCWDDKLLECFDIPSGMMPEVLPSAALFGYTDSALTGTKIPICGVAGDQQAALFGQCCFERGDVKVTYGTGAFLLMNTGAAPIESKNGLLTTLAATDGKSPEYALEGSVFMAGAAIQWLRDGMHLIKNARESERYALEAEDSNGIYVVPAFTGLGAPHWNPHAMGTVVGLTQGCTDRHFVRAVLESLAYQVNDVIRSMEEDAALSIKALKADGGASLNGFLMQFQADVSDAVADRPECIETTAYGAAALAGLYAGYWKKKEEIRANLRPGERFTPMMGEKERRRLLAGWQRALKCALVWAEEII